MAILEKRRAVNQLPRFQRYQDTRAGDRAAALRGETPITSAIRQLAGSSGYGPMGESEGFNPMGGDTGGRGGMGGGRGGAGPMGGGMGGAGKGTVDKFGNIAGQPKNAVTSALKGPTAGTKTAGTTAAGTTSKLPGLTSKTTDATGKTITSAGTGAGKTAGVTGAKTLTSTGSGTAKTTGVTKNTGTKTTGSSGSTLGKTITSALTGAALGAGTKFVIDKLTGKKVAVTDTGKTSGTVKDSGTGLKGNASNIGSNIGKTIVDTNVKKVADKITSTDKNASSGTGLTSKTSNTGLKGNNSSIGSNIGKTVTDKAVNAAADKVTSAIKPKSPVTPKSGGAGTPKGGGAASKTAADIKAENPELTDEEVEAELDRIRDEEESLGVPEGAVDNGDGTYSVTEDGMVTRYDSNGNLLGMEAAEDDVTGTAGEDGGDDEDDANDGTTTQVLDDGTVVTLDENGDIVSYTDTDGSVYDADGNEITEGGGDLDAGGNTTETLEDGTQITYDADGDIVSYTDTDGVTYDGDGDVIGGDDTTTGGGTRGLGGGNVTESIENDDGTTSVTYDDGSTATIDENGDIISSEESDEGFFTDDEGNLYDANGDLYQYADGTFYGDEESTEGEVAYTDDYGNTYDYNGDLIAEADHSDYVQYDDEGNAYNWDGELIESDEEYTAEDEYAADDEYTSDDEYSYEDDYSYDDLDYGKKGGLFKMADGGSLDEPIDEKQNADGTITQMFDDGSSITYTQEGEVMKVSEAKGYADGDLVGYSDTDEEVQDWQNTDYNFGEEDDPTMTGYTLTGNRNPVGNAYMRSSPASLTDIVGSSSMNGVDVDFSDNGDGTASYWDGNFYVTVDSDTGNELYRTDEDGNIVSEGAQTTSESTQANQGIQYFDDGSYIQTFDDGTSITFDAEGNPFRATDSEGNSQLANTSSYDDYGNQTISDYYGNIVKVLDPQGNVIPLGGGRVNAGRVTNAGGAGAIGTDTESEIQRKINEQKEGRATKSAIDDLLAGLNTYGGAGAAGAVLGALLSDSDLFGGGGGGGHSFDMTGVGAIDPRTTDFGIGPANYVGYDQYGTPEQMPELYGRELYQNLNAPGFNEVNPGDYAKYDEEEFGSNQFMEGDAQDQEMADEGYAEGMAEGGMPTGGLGQTAPQTYYTFGTPVDPLQNLRNPAPYQPQPQQPQMQPQMPPQAAQNAQQAPQGMQPMGMPQMPPMPQGMPPAGMKSGGLPAWSNVPITNGRLNFRKGAAVHGAGDGQSDDIPAMLADGEYVIDAETVAQIGNGSTKAGAQALDKFRENIRMHKRSAPVNKIPPKTKALTSYLKGAR